MMATAKDHSTVAIQREMVLEWIRLADEFLLSVGQ
jgi:hypothetical protein